MDAALRPMSTSQVLDRTFYLYKNNFLLFLGIAIVGPALTLISGFAQLRIFGPLVMPDPAKVDPALLQSFFMRTIITAVTGIIVYTVGQAVATGATIHAVSMVHLGKTTTIMESYRKIKPVFWRILGVFLRVFLIAWGPLIITYVLFIVVAIGIPLLIRGSGGGAVAGALLLVVVGLLSFAGLIFSVIWMIYAYCRYGLAVPACTVENLPPKYAVIRSKFLTKDGLGRILGIYVLTAIMSFILTTVLQTPAFMIANPFAMKPGAVSTAYLFWAMLGEFLGRTLAGPIATIAIALVYYDQRVRKEAFDLQLMMESMGQASPAQALAATTVTYNN